MAERIQYVDMRFSVGVTSPARDGFHGSERSILLDAFEVKGNSFKRCIKLGREGEAVIATCLKTGRIREYPWASVRQATRADDRYVNGDPRQPLKPTAAAAPAAQQGKAAR